MTATYILHLTFEIALDQLSGISENRLLELQLCLTAKASWAFLINNSYAPTNTHTITIATGTISAGGTKRLKNEMRQKHKQSKNHHQRAKREDICAPVQPLRRQIGEKHTDSER